MKTTYCFRSLSLSVLLLVVSSSDARIWRTPLSLVLTPTTSSSLSYLRGGDDAKNILQVPDDTSQSTIDTRKHSGLARGGSTSTKKTYTVSGTGSISTTTATTTSARAHTAAQSISPAGALSIDENNNVTTTPTAKTATMVSKEERAHIKIAKKLKNRNARNLRRKVLHASFGFFFAALNHFIPKAKFVPGMTLLTSATLVMELLRYRKGFGWMNDTLHMVLGQSLRKHEMDGKFTGSFYYFLGVTLTSALYPNTCATLGICQLAIADPTASYFGRATRHVYWSRIENGLGGFGRNKGILGFIGGALACLPMNYRLLSLAKFGYAPGQSSLWMASLALGFAGAFADLAVPTPALTLPKKVFGVRVPPLHVDDNVVVPVFSAFACQYIFRLVQFPADLVLSKYLVL